MSRTILVRGFEPGTTEREILMLFTPRSSVLSARLIGTRGQPLRRRCLVRMRGAEDAERAVRELDGQEYNGRVLRIEVVGRQLLADVAGDPAPRNLFQPISPERHAAGALEPRGADALASPESLVISFVLGARAFGHVADHLPVLQPSTRVAVQEARDRGGAAAMYFFVDLADDVVRDVRNCLRVRSRRKDPDGRACDAAASAIEGRRRSAWYLAPCPQCGGRLRPASWLTPAVFVLQCATCRWAIPR